MQKLFTSKETHILLSLKHIRPLFRLRDSAGTTEHLHHVHWEHLQMFQQKELTDVKIAHQVTSGFFCKSSEEMPTATNLKECWEGN